MWLLLIILASLINIVTMQQRPTRAAYYARDSLKNKELQSRLFERMRLYYQDGGIRMKDMLYYRFMYEESPHYELGYLFGEVIERYKKIIASTKRKIQKSDPYSAHLKRMELIQLWFMEIYHLVNMMHEIYPKYKSVAEFMTLKTETEDVEKEWEQKKNLIAQKKREQRDRERKKKRLSELLNIMGSKSYGGEPGQRPEPYNKWWPLDYGWEPEVWEDNNFY